jgi:subtilase family serine protease
VLLLLPGTRVWAAQRQLLHGHVPEAVARLNLKPLGRLPATNRLHIAINLPLRNIGERDLLHRKMYDPASTNFHRWLTPEVFTKRFGPSPEDYQAVLDFASANGLSVTRPHPGCAIAGVDGSAADIERTLHLKMLLYQHPTELRTFYAPDVEPSLDLTVPVLAISGLDNFVGHHSHLKERVDEAADRSNHSPSAGSATNGCYMGKDFRKAYVPDAENLTGAGQVVGLVEFTASGGYNPADIRLYETQAGLANVPIVPVFQNVTTVPVGTDNREFSVDIEMVISMAPGLDAVVLYEPGDTVTDEEMYQEMAYPTHGERRPNQISTSWSGDYSAASTNYLIQLAMQGQSYFYASGDDAAFPVNTDQVGSYGLAYVTEVGGTELYMNGAGQSWQSEAVWGNYGTQVNTGAGSGSAGGYFTAIPIPFYQREIEMTLNGGSTRFLNAPDVAMVADQIYTLFTRHLTNAPQESVQRTTAGTSCATPLWAAFTSLVNEQAQAQGKPTAGFLNPALYAIGQSPSYTNCFHDITSGNTTWSKSPTAYFATVGYDLCTGWGSPTGANLINALVNLGGPVFVDFSYTGSLQEDPGTIVFPWKTLTEGVSAVSAYGTVFIIDGGSSSETMTISKAMTVNASGGPATVGVGH